MIKALVLGTQQRQDAFRQLTLANADLQFFNDDDLLDNVFLDIEDAESGHDVDLANFQVVFDLNLDEYPQNLMVYNDHPHLTVFGSAVKESLAQMVHVELNEPPTFTLFGLNALPTFLERKRLEVSLYEESDREHLENTLGSLELEFEVVEDRVGMVTPRIVCMIINEACFVLGEGTAEVADVDRAMKLGTAYPRGPFEWADAIGIHNVFEVLNALRNDTGEEKYKIAPRLKRHYLKGKKFYS